MGEWQVYCNSHNCPMVRLLGAFSVNPAQMRLRLLRLGLMRPSYQNKNVSWMIIRTAVNKIYISLDLSASISERILPSISTTVTHPRQWIKATPPPTTYWFRLFTYRRRAVAMLAFQCHRARHCVCAWGMRKEGVSFSLSV